ncbi:TonB-dependent receptor [Microbulbifer bruguierae]|uniref:TonB-dependent receptor n=1 Tax=Microbulbifer bruguierae TaxID=3029061 RepID=A0ABY8NDC4_9GAMM|nr:TonB-dependent receptor [Microbulbifer bruguierae]WGL15752.1 TonB-dependent receptor [Microbulbifer bruguierae]
MKTFELKPLTLAMAIIAVPAFAQEANTSGDASLEEITVTGSYAGSLAKALDTKRDATGMVDSILAEDIADFPDQNLAESLQRIPGVAIDRDDGEGRTITVRGLGSTYTRVQVNGMQAQSLAAGSGGVRTDRSFDFNVFASELFNRLDVYKTTSADLQEGSLGATVALQTARPLDYDNFTLVTNVQEGYNSQSGEFAPRASGLFSVSNEDKTLGFLLSAAFSQKNNSVEGAETVRWETWGGSRGNGVFNCSACETDEERAAVAAAWHPRIPRIADKTNEQDRLGLTSSFQWQPADSTLVTVDALYSNVDVTRNEPYLGAISLARLDTGASTGSSEMDIIDYMIDGNGTMTSGTVTGTDVRSENFQANWGSEYQQYSIALEHDFSDRLRMSALVGATESVMDNREVTVVYEHYSDGDSRQNIEYADSSDQFRWNYNGPNSLDLSYGFDLSDPANWELSEYRDRLYDASSETSHANVDVEFDLNDAFTLKAGANSNSYGYDIVGLRADKGFGSADSADGVVDGNACGISAAVSANDGKAIKSGGETYFQADFGISETLFDSGCWSYAVRAGDTRNVDEDTYGYFVQVDMDTDVFGGRRLRGNLGVRKAYTELASTGVTAYTDENDVDHVVDVTVKHKYDDTLPSLNLALNVAEDVILRASAAKVMSRPNLTDLNPGGSVSIFGEPKVSYGNPFIEPFRAKAYDLSAEWYFAESALVSLALFQKDIESFPTSDTVDMSWSQTGLPDSMLGAQVDQLKDAIFEVSRRVNGGGATVQGWELQYQQPLTFLPGPEWVQNFGVQSNYTFVDAETDSGSKMTGVSETSYNLTVYWENDDFQARISNAYRGEYLTNLSREEYVGASSFIDFSASYNVSENLKVSFEALNLGDEPKYRYLGEDVKRLYDEHFTGAQYFVGAQYKF